ncbi:MAG: hypothetical protein ABJF50_06870 [Paracoccaceae bacterium]
MTTSNEQAQRKIGRSISDLLKARDDTTGLSSAEKQTLNTAIKALRAEYLALSNSAQSATYAEITMALTGAKTQLEEIKDKRNKFKNGLVTASKLLGTLTSVLKLIT